MASLHMHYTLCRLQHRCLLRSGYELWEDGNHFGVVSMLRIRVGIFNHGLESGGHLGSSALLGDPEDITIDEPRRGSIAPPGGP